MVYLFYVVIIAGKNPVDIYLRMLKTINEGERNAETNPGMAMMSDFIYGTKK
jgi:hypothetical protein